MPRQHRSTRKSNTQFQHQGVPSVFTCPDCSGTLFLIQDSGIVRYRCRIGHVYSPESMMEAQEENVERSMWTATRALEEQAEYTALLSRELGDVDAQAAGRLAAKSRAAQHSATILRNLTTRGSELSKQRSPKQGNFETKARDLR